MGYFTVCKYNENLYQLTTKVTPLKGKRLDEEQKEVKSNLKKALDEFVTRKAERFYVEERPISEFFGQNVFDLEKMKRYLSALKYSENK